MRVESVVALGVGLADATLQGCWTSCSSGEMLPADVSLTSLLFCTVLTSHCSQLTVEKQEAANWTGRENPSLPFSADSRQIKEVFWLDRMEHRLRGPLGHQLKLNDTKTCLVMWFHSNICDLYRPLSLYFSNGKSTELWKHKSWFWKSLSWFILVRLVGGKDLPHMPVSNWGLRAMTWQPAQFSNLQPATSPLVSVSQR